MRAAAVVLTALVLGLAVACTVDEVVGSNGVTDGGTAVCPGTSPGICDPAPVCGGQICRVSCTDLQDCVTTCSGTSCTFQCERSVQTCTPSCDPGACSMSCVPNGEQIVCTLSCNPQQTCAADCHNGTCTVACGDLKPATTCDGGVYSCSGSCPP